MLRITRVGLCNNNCRLQTQLIYPLKYWRTSRITILKTKIIYFNIFMGGGAKTYVVPPTFLRLSSPSHFLRLCHQLIMPPISKYCSNTFLEHSIMYVSPCEWNKLSEHIRTSNFDCFRMRLKQCYLHNNMDADCKFIYYCYLWCDHCWLL